MTTEAITKGMVAVARAEEECRKFETERFESARGGQSIAFYLRH